MPIIRKSDVTYKPRHRGPEEANPVTAILEIELENFIVYVFPGSLSDFDILIKYKDESKSFRLRTPKHIHWAVDFLLKKQGDERTTEALLVRARAYWDLCKPLKTRDFETIKNVLEQGFTYFNPQEYQTLNSFGEYDVDFLVSLMILLPVQEKTNYSGAFMFRNVLDSLLVKDLDIFSVTSIATHNGR